MTKHYFILSHLPLQDSEFSNLASLGLFADKKFVFAKCSNSAKCVYVTQATFLKNQVTKILTVENLSKYKTHLICLRSSYRGIVYKKLSWFLKVTHIDSCVVKTIQSCKLTKIVCNPLFFLYNEIFILTCFHYSRI